MTLFVAPDTSPFMTIAISIDELIDNFAFLDDWEERYTYVLELGKALEPLPDADHNSDTKVEGCVSQVWLRADYHKDEDVLRFAGDSDSFLVRGLVAIVLSAFSGKSKADIQAIDAGDLFLRLGLNENLTPQRSNGLASMVRYIKAYASGERAPHRLI